MLSVTLLCVGKLKEPYYAAALAEYQKRLGAFCRFSVTEIP
ncbi:MAG: 23S rRNA (pseudouridine(1915)-N(3))-methyltransferase RlmH, partial [Oscillospiraceae bacterium]|nr:23S rRNA (pseudouridine(1915)-N(3))-methyltransferase RlmH [Oscillospiraceae bacterium]